MMRSRRTLQPALLRHTVGYCRVSTEDQAREGVSLAAQEARIGAYATAMGFSVSEVIHDAGESAKSLKRPGIGKILDAARRGEIERIVVAKLDRLTRSVRDLSDLIDLCAKHDVALVSVGETLDTSTAAGRMVVHMLGVVAAWEREAIGERTATALAHKRRARSVYGTTPFGYVRKGNSIVPVVREQTVLREALRMDRAGASFREIAAMLVERQVHPKRGKAWHASSVRAMLRSRIVTESEA
jgi:DNA invertase Pin-like site-specific DNA recombinase